MSDISMAPHCQTAKQQQNICNFTLTAAKMAVPNVTAAMLQQTAGVFMQVATMTVAEAAS